MFLLINHEVSVLEFLNESDFQLLRLTGSNIFVFLGAHQRL